MEHSESVEGRSDALCTATEDRELIGLRKVAEEMAEMNNIIGELNEKATQLNTLMRATEPKLVTMYMPFKKAVYESKIPAESISDAVGAPQ